MVGLTKYFASIYGSNGIRVNMVSPGPVKNKQKKNLQQEIIKMTPMGRLGRPEDLLGLIFFLLMISLHTLVDKIYWLMVQKLLFSYKRITFKRSISYFITKFFFVHYME